MVPPGSFWWAALKPHDGANAPDEQRGNQRRRGDVQQPARPRPPMRAACADQRAREEANLQHRAELGRVDVIGLRGRLEAGVVSLLVQERPELFAVAIEQHGERIAERQQRIASKRGVVHERPLEQACGPLGPPEPVVGEIGRPAQGGGGIRVGNRRHDGHAAFVGEPGQHRAQHPRVRETVGFADEDDRRRGRPNAGATGAGQRKWRGHMYDASRAEGAQLRPVDRAETLGRADDEDLEICAVGLLPERRNHRPERVVGVGGQHDRHARR